MNLKNFWYGKIPEWIKLLQKIYNVFNLEVKSISKHVFYFMLYIRKYRFFKIQSLYYG